ncbi:ROK family glucokinase [Candidatus Sumerlaeota bacterium]|nr:ROK family glucokinase [Candidatus Sumerlaeota bacterium]
MKSYAIGVDLGGTFIKTALVRIHGEIVGKVEIDSERDRGPEGVIENILRAIRLVMKQNKTTEDEICAIGIGSPGPLDTRKGIVCNAVNLPGWINVPLRDRIEKVFGIPANLENDANAAAYGEYWKGAGQNSSIMLAYTLGTGVGGGIIINGELIRGASDCAGELGHVTIVPDGRLCGCGNQGCLEAYASATSLVRIVELNIKQGRAPLLQKWSREGKKLTAKLIYEAYQQGDVFAKEMLEQLGYYLGVGVSTAVMALNPDVVVIGGGMMNAGAVIIEPVRREVKRRVFPEHFENLKIIPAELGNDAGVIGSVGLALQMTQNQKSQRL